MTIIANPRCLPCSSHVCAAVCAQHRELPQYYSEEHHHRAGSHRTPTSKDALPSSSPKKSHHKIIRRNTKRYSISIIPVRITATAANACGFLLTS
jgi:hypothetical protein